MALAARPRRGFGTKRPCNPLRKEARRVTPTSDNQRAWMLANLVGSAELVCSGHGRYGTPRADLQTRSQAQVLLRHLGCVQRELLSLLAGRLVGLGGVPGVRQHLA